MVCVAAGEAGKTVRAGRKTGRKKRFTHYRQIVFISRRGRRGEVHFTENRMNSLLFFTIIKNELFKNAFKRIIALRALHLCSLCAKLYLFHAGFAEVQSTL
jgi:hypothetical protein